MVSMRNVFCERFGVEGVVTLSWINSNGDTQPVSSNMYYESCVGGVHLKRYLW